MTAILKAIRQAIKASGKTRYQLSKETGLDQSHLSRLMKGGAGLSLEVARKAGRGPRLGHHHPWQAETLGSADSEPVLVRAR